MNDNQIRGWVLAEWLTALALGAVIVAITLPNYIEAQTRSKVSGLHADLSRIETALVTYKIDNGRWIDDAFYWGNYAEPRIPCSGMNDAFVWGQLTTPVAYLRSVPIDPFFHYTQDSRFPQYPYFSYYGQTGWIRAVAEINGVANDQFLGDWIIVSPGPNQSWGYGEWNIVSTQRDQGFPRLYDPSNGIVSYGDIVYWENYDRTLIAPPEPVE